MEDSAETWVPADFTVTRELPVLFAPGARGAGIQWALCRVVQFKEAAWAALTSAARRPAVRFAAT